MSEKPGSPGGEDRRVENHPAERASQDTNTQRKRDPENLQGPAGSTPSQDKYDNPTAKIWSVYMSEANPHDTALIESWTRDMDGILIFAGLFSAVITAFIIESYSGLSPDPNATTVALLQQISQQLAGNAVQNATLTPESFNPTSSALRVNAFWFLSLCLALTCALAATLVQQWARHYTQAVQRRPAPHLQARMRRYLFDGMEKFKMSALVDGIPTLLHASVCLFFAGLVDFLYQTNLRIAMVALSIIAVCGGLYFLMTILPVFHRQSPFRTPLSEPCWALCRFLGLLRYREYGRWARFEGSMAEGREYLATEDNPDNTELAVAGLCWALKNLTEDAELQPFVEGIPAFCKEDEDAEMMRNIVIDDDAELLWRVIALLWTCANPSSLNAASRKVRSIACLNALAKLCELHSTHPWTFISNHEGRLRSLIIPLIKDSDQQVAGAAKIVAATVVEHIRSLTLDDPWHPKSLSDLNDQDEMELAVQRTMGWKLPEIHELIKEWDPIAYDKLFPPRDSSTPSEAHEDDSPDPTESAHPFHSGDGIASDPQESQTNNTLALGIVDAVEDGRVDEELAPSTPSQATGPLQMDRNQTILVNAPVGEKKDRSHDEQCTDSVEAGSPSRTFDPDDGIHLEDQEAATNATAPPVTTPPVVEGMPDADPTGSAARVTGLPQRLDSDKHIHFQQQEPEMIIPTIPSSDERSTESVRAVGGSEAVGSGDNIHPRQPGPPTHSLTRIRSATGPLVQEGSIEGEGEREGENESESEG